MPNVRLVLFSALVNVKKWPVNPRIYTLIALVIAFLAYHTAGLTEFAKEQGLSLTPWILPHLMNPPVLQVFACLTILMFSDAPFVDRHMPFIVVRSGRKNWIFGQLVYIFVASFIYTLFIFLVSILVLVPQVKFSMDWGVVYKSLAMDYSLAPRATVFFSEELMNIFSPISATLISLGLIWLGAVFIGVLIFCFNIVIGHMSGLIAAGFFIFMSIFSIVHGRIVLGEWIIYISPISWMSISFIDWNGTGDFLLPSVQYVLGFFIVTIIVMSVAAIKVFCKKDVQI